MPKYFYTCLILGLLLICGCKPDKSGIQQPNIVILMADDLTMAAIHGLGNKQVISPNLDQLIKSGTVFSNAYTAGSPDAAVDKSSREMFYSGYHFLNPHATENTFPNLFKTAGYDTFFTGKWTAEKEQLVQSFDQCKKVFFGDAHLIEEGGHDMPIVHDLVNGEFEEKKSEDFSSKTFANALIDFLWEEKRTRPFLAISAFTSPHRPYMAPEHITNKYQDAKIKLPKNFQPEHSFDNGALTVREEKIHPTPRNEEWVKQDIAAYYAMVTELDQQIGRIIDALKLKKLDKKTIIIVTSDNGIALGQHGLIGKHNLYKHSTNVPLIFSGPGIQVGAETEAICYVHDIYPTVCALANIDIPAQIDGKSFSPSLTDPNKKTRTSILLAYGNTQRSFLAADNWKLIKYFAGKRERVQLFDLIEDPYELKDLSKQPVFRKKLGQMNDSLTVKMANNNDGMLQLELALNYIANKTSPEIEIKTSAPNVSIHYTIDGKEPTLSSRRYYQPFKIVDLNGSDAAAKVKAAIFIGGKRIGNIEEIEVKSNPQLSAK